MLNKIQTTQLVFFMIIYPFEKVPQPTPKNESPTTKLIGSIIFHYIYIPSTAPQLIYIKEDHNEGALTILHLYLEPCKIRT
jgi:hypothetical protein